MNKFKLEEKNIVKLIHSMNTKKIVFIDRKKNKDYKKNYKNIIYKLDMSNYKYSSYDINPKFKGEKVHIFGLGNLYIKVKIIKNKCKVLSLHVAEYEL